MVWMLFLAQDHEVVHAVAGWQTGMLAFMLLGMIALLAFEEKLHARKSVITGVLAIGCLLLAAGFGILPFDDLTGGGMTLPVYIPAIDWEVIAIIFGSSLFVDLTSQSGIFSWIAIKLTKWSGGDPFRLLMAYGFLTVVFSAVLNNVAAMIIVGSLTGVSIKKLRREELLLGFLLIEGLLTNIGGLLTLISSVPNIIVGNTAGISFVQFFFMTSPYVVVASFVTIFLGAKVFGIRRLTDEVDRAEAKELVSTFDENDGIPSKRFFRFSAVTFVLFIGALAGQSVIPLLEELGMGFVAITFAVMMLVAFKHEVSRFYSALDWDLLFFFMFLFMIINVMEHGEVLHLIGGWITPMTGLGDTVGTSLLMGASAVASSVTDNIPLAAMLAKVLGNQGTPSDSPMWWAVVFGANLGGNITPIGSASTLVAVTVMHKYHLKMTFVGFVKKAAPFAALQIVLAAIYVAIRFA